MIWHVPALETVTTIAAVVAGCALALLALELYYLPQNVIVVLNPVETMFLWAAESQRDLRVSPSLFSAEMVRHVLEGFLGMLARRTFILQSSPRPTIFLEWLLIVGAIIAKASAGSFSSSAPCSRQHGVSTPSRCSAV